KYGGAMGMKALAISRMRALTYISDIKEQFTLATTLDPNHIEARWALVELYLQLPGILGGSVNKAKKYADELQEISPVDGYLSKGYIEEYDENEKAAEKYYKLAIEVGGSPTTYEKLTNLYEKNDKPEEAIKNAEKSLAKHQRNQLNYQIGKIAAEYDMEPQLGIACLRSYIENHSYKDGVPTHWAYYRLAQIYRNLGDKKRAMECIEKAIASSPDFEEALAIRADMRNL
ncbi:MAG: tetratricopeptide repeat protein, partial [Leeuwenhoekiella sp.]